MNSLKALDSIRIVMVNTTDTGNIGAVARAMKNMGLQSLHLVEPKNLPDEKAFRRAGHALDVMDNIVIHKTLEDAVAGCGLVIGTSARERKIPWPLLDARDAAIKAIEETSTHPVAVVFGREDRGLTNEELHKCHLHLNIPTHGGYSSLNVAAAIQVVCYELLIAAQQGQKAAWEEDMQAKADLPAMENFYQHLEQVLVHLDYLNPDEPKQTMSRLRRLFNRARPEAIEINMLRGILKSIKSQKGIE